MTKAVWPPSSDQRAVHIAIAALVTAPMLDIFLCGILLVQGYAYLARMHRHTRSRAHRPPHSPAPVVPNRKEEINNSNSDNHANGGGGGQQSIRSSAARVLTTHSSYLLVFLLFFSAFKTACSFSMLYQAAFHTGDNWLSLGATWPYYSGPLLTAIIGLTVQFFYIHRLYFLLRAQTGKILGNWWIQILISATIVLLVLISFVTIVISTHLVRLGMWAIYVYYSMTHLIAASLGDLLITFLTILCIQRANRRTVHPVKRSRLQQIARLTAVSAAVPTACAILNVILVAQPDKDVTRWHIVPSFLLGKLYVFSLLWTLEYRQRIISSDRSTERNKVPNRLDAQLIGVGVVVGGAAAGGSGKSDDRLARSASDDTSHKGGSDRSGSGCGRKKGIEDLVERGLSCRQGRKVVPTTAATHYPPSSIPLRMEMMSSEQGERRTSLGFLNRTSMFARTVLTPAGTQMTEENDHDVDLGNGVADADVGDIESQWGVQSLDKKGEIGFIDSLDTAKWEEKIGDQGLKN